MTSILLPGTSAAVLATRETIGDATETLNCGDGGGTDSHLHLRIVAIFVIGIGSTFGSLFPVLVRKSKLLNVPKSVFK